MRVNHNRVSTMLRLNRKAYTLSQFILLWVLGVLFVILVCLNVFRYRATAHAKEAEAFMQQVRSEQEDRCAVGRKYAVYNKHLKTFYKHKKGTRYIRYDVASGQGITAHHKVLDFTLQMPSYADGRICCDNCGKLNRYYAPCDVLKKSKDFIPAETQCIAYMPGKKGKGSPKPASSPAEPEASVVQATEKSMADTENTAAQTAAVETTAPATEQPSALPAQEDAVAVSPDTQAQPETFSLQTPAEPVAQQQEGTLEDKPVVKQPKPKATCKIPPQGEFFIDGCEVYQADARGSVVHTWNFDICAYETTQTCMVPARWKRSTDTKEEKGLYPSDLDDYCTTLLKSAPCAEQAAAGRECGTVDEVCYKDCQITDKTEVKESALIILYDVQVKVERLRCMPSKEVTVKIP